MDDADDRQGLGEGLYGIYTPSEMLQEPGNIQAVIPRCLVPAEAIVEDFDELAPGGPYVTNGQDVADIGDPGNIVRRGEGTITSPNVWQVNATPDEPVGSSPHLLEFDIPLRYIGLHVGTAARDPVIVRLFGLSGEEIVDIDTVRLGSGPTTTCLLVRGDSITAAHLTVTPVEDAQPTEEAIDIDRLFYGHSDAYPAGPFTWTSIDVRYPVDGQVIQAREHNPLSGIISTRDVIDRVLVTVRNQYGVSMRHAHLKRITTSAGEVGWSFAIDDIPLQAGRNSVAVTATGPTTSGATTLTVSGVEADDQLGSRPAVDIMPLAVEITQGVSGAVPSYDTPHEAGITIRAEELTSKLVANRTTVVRAYAHTTPAQDSNAPKATAVLYGFRNGELLPGSPLSPGLQHRPVATTGAVPLEHLRAQRGGSWNFTLPQSWTAPGSIDLKLEVNPEGPGFWPEPIGPARQNNAVSVKDLRFVAITSPPFSLFMRGNGTEGPSVSDLADSLRGLWTLLPMPDRLNIASIVTLSAGATLPDGNGFSIELRSPREDTGCTAVDTDDDRSVVVGACSESVAGAIATALTGHTEVGMFAVDEYGWDMSAMQPIPPRTTGYLSGASDGTVWTGAWTWVEIMDALQSGEYSDSTQPTRPPRSGHDGEPLALILAPADDAAIEPGRLHELRGVAFDSEGTPYAEAAMEWWIDGQLMGRGQSLPGIVLGPGSHGIELRVRPGAQVVAADTAAVTALLDSDGDGLSDEEETRAGLDPFDHTDGARDGDGDGLAAWLEVRANTDLNTVDTDFDTFSDAVELRARSDPRSADSIPKGLYGWKGDDLPTVGPPEINLEPTPWFLHPLVVLVAAVAIVGGLAWVLRPKQRQTPFPA